VIWLLFVVLLRLQLISNVSGDHPVMKGQGASESTPASIPTVPVVDDGGTSLDPLG
jgi:hypothetical protein